MAANFPTSLDVEAGVGGGTTPVPATSDTTDSPSHAGLHQKKGDAIVAIEGKVGTGASTPTVGKVLTGDGTGTSTWQTLPVLRVTATSQSIAHATDTQADLADAPGVNNGGWTSWPSTYNGWNVPMSGVYRVTAFAFFSANNTGFRQIAITDEGAGRNATNSPAVQSATTRIEVNDVWPLTAGDEIGMKVYQTSGGALTVSSVLMANLLYVT